MGKIDEYKFMCDGITFHVNFPPDRNLKKQVANLFSGYDLYVHMKDFNTEIIKESNKDILEAIYSLGVYKIIQPGSFGSNGVVLFEDLPKESFIRADLMDYFYDYKNNYPRVGIISFIDNIQKNKPKVLYTEWLPRMQNIESVLTIPNWETRYDILCINIIQYKGVSYFVLFEINKDKNWDVISYVEIGNDIFKKDSSNYLNRTKMLQITSMNLTIDEIFKLWSVKFIERRKMCKLGEIELTFYDILIYLYQLQEFISKVETPCKTNTLLWTNLHNEFNNEFRDFKFKYTGEIRSEILKAFDERNINNKADEISYAFINDFFYKDLL